MSDEISDRDDLASCENCSGRHPIRAMTATEDGCDLCPDCQAKARAVFDACAHFWQPTHNQWGEPSQVCDLCSFIVADEDFVDLFGNGAPLEGETVDTSPPTSPAQEERVSGL